MTTVFSPGTTLTDIMAALGNVALNQVSGINRVYTQTPDGAPESGSLIIGLPQFIVKDEVVGKYKVELTFPCAYCVRRKDGREDIVQVANYFLPIINAYMSWVNQELTTDVYLSHVRKGGVTQLTYSGQVYRALVFTVSVVSEFNIPLS